MATGTTTAAGPGQEMTVEEKISQPRSPAAARVPEAVRRQQGPPVKAGEFILGYPGQAGVPLPMPQPDVLGRNGTFAGLRKYQSRVGTFNRFLREHGRTSQERELLAAKLVGRWRSGAPLTLAPVHDDPELGADPRRTTRSPAGCISCSSAPRRWPRWSSCSRTG